MPLKKVLILMLRIIEMKKKESNKKGQIDLRNQPGQDLEIICICFEIFEPEPNLQHYRFFNWR